MRVILKAAFGDVGDVHHRFYRNQAQWFDQIEFISIQAYGAHGLGFVQGGQYFIQYLDQGDGVLVTAFGFFAFALHGFFHGFHVGQGQFCIDDFDIGQRIDFACNVNDVAVFKTAHHMGNGIGFADIGQKFVTQAFAFGGTRYQTGNVYKFNNGRLYFLRFDDVDQRLHALVWYFYDADVRLDGTEGIVFCRDARFGDGVEQRGFAYVWQADDTAFHNGLTLE